MLRALLFTLGALAGFLLVTADTAKAADGDGCKGHADYDSLVNWQGSNPQCFVICDSKVDGNIQCDPFTLGNINYVRGMLQITEDTDDGTPPCSPTVTFYTALDSTTDQSSQEWVELTPTDNTAYIGQDYGAAPYITSVLTNMTNCADVDVVMLLWDRVGSQ